MRALIVTMLVAWSGCASWLPAPDPMSALDSEKPGARAQCLLVFLPGGGDSAESFVKEGFVQEVERHHYSIDMVAADATMGYYTRGVFTERLARDVVTRRLRRGYKQLWLVGPSLGGFGTLLYSRQRPIGEVTGVFALAPFLGTRTEVFRQIEQAGGLEHWSAPQRSKLQESNLEWELWRWLQALTQHKERGPELYLGYGTEDGLARTNAFLSAAMPVERVYTRAGGHSWATWRQLFSEFLERGPLREACGGDVSSTALRNPETADQTRAAARPEVLQPTAAR
ncbi:MAG: hypothetical protein RL701_224 [Pseudomonadota bacterium]|jgi:pimeloyl-ACP methyl ester carboxylesterase